MKQKKQIVRMKDIAKAAGVSKSTVSKAINNKPYISEEMRAHIFKICEQMGYQINFIMQDMIKERQTGMTHNIAFITVGIKVSDPAYVEALDGIAKGIDENNLRLLLERLKGTEQSLYDLPPILRDARIDGFIITGALNPHIMALLQKLDIPYIILGTYSADIIKGSINFSTDFEYGIQQIIKILKNTGHNKIAYFTEYIDNYFEKITIARVESALTINDLNFDRELLYISTGKFSGAFTEMKNIFAQKTLPFDSIICLDFRTALEISHLAFAHAEKYNSTAVTIVTRKLLSHYKLPMQTIYYDAMLEEIAYDGIKTLVDIIAGKNSTQTKKVLISPKITSNNPLI